MGKIDLKSGSIVNYMGEQWKVLKTVDFKSLKIQNIYTHDVFVVSIDDLQSNVVETHKNRYIDSYSREEWAEALRREDIIKDLVFVSRTKNDVEKIAKEHGYSYVTLYNWIKRYEQTGEVSSLVSGTAKRGKKGNRLDAKVDEIINDILENVYLNQQRYSFNRVYNKIYLACRHENLKAPHRNTIRYRISQIEPKKVVKRRDGYKKAQEQFKNYDGKFPAGKFPFDFVQIDHTPLDIRLVDRIYRKPLGRPTLTMAIDVYSRMVVGVYVSFLGPAFYNVSQCMFNIFTKKDNLLKKYGVEGEWEIFGIPRIIGVDNGPDLVCEDMQRVCDEYSISLQKRPVGRPQFGPHIERAFKTHNGDIHNLPGTTFSDIAEKGDYDSDKHASYTIEEFTTWLLHYIVNIYHKKYHSEICMTPEQKYLKGIIGNDENPGVGLPPVLDNIEDVKISLLPTVMRTVQKDGITIDGVTYYSDVLRHWIGIKNDENRRVSHKIKRDPMNIQRIYFYDSELKEYFEVPYRKISAPAMTLWDLYAVKKYLKEQKIRNYNEDDIFDAYEKLYEIEDNIESTHKAHLKKYKNKSKKIKEMVSKNNEKLNDKYSEIDTENTDELYKDIQIYDITEN
ncbi:Mu transposase C-terminal domain-containing protein [Arcobacter roscoffensis]|uniref:Mu transposase C-terminal domain-containing protein n=1 Tax=Arcobacter roscoffensis TaxID=2961520 RepID=A0ABY5E2W5_9BACT|nr:Mu transposase C-terminal domain-containing protein [Arcobacter roscoffensis]UTJ06217.1 Mu transposase C-terminal domain-containing protein [Arcobacter roscoffensis]